VETGLDAKNNASSEIAALRQQLEQLQRELAISQQERAQALEYQNRLTHGLALGNIGYWECDLSRQEFIFNDATYEQVYKTTAEKLGGYRISIRDYSETFVHPADREWVALYFQKAIATSEPLYRVEHRVTFGDKSEGFLLVTFQIIRNQNNEAVKVFGICQDITYVKKREHELRRFADIFEQTTDLVSITDTQGRPTYINPAGRKLLGLEEETQQIETIAPFCGDENSSFTKLVAKASSEGSWRGETVIRRSSGETIPVWLDLLAHHDLDGSIAFISVVGRDLTLLKRAEDTLRQNIAQEEQLRAQQAMLRELSTPLIPLTDNLVVMPIIGTIDSTRAQQIIEVLLEGINTYGAETAILDITGVRVIDTQVADALIRAAQAARLLGSEVILTGISPEVAQTLVHLAIDLSGIVTYRDLRDCFSHLFS